MDVGLDVAKILKNSRELQKKNLEKENKPKGINFVP